jgi:hypothetical protein
LLQGRHRAQITPERHNLALFPNLDCGIEDWYIRTSGGRVIDMAPLAGRCRGCVSQQSLDLRPALYSHGFSPSLAYPLAVTLVRKLLASIPHVADYAFTVNDKRNVRRRRNQARSCFNVKGVK